jgi:hypothetical protein
MEVAAMAKPVSEHPRETLCTLPSLTLTVRILLINSRSFRGKVTKLNLTSLQQSLLELVLSLSKIAQILDMAMLLTGPLMPLRSVVMPVMELDKKEDGLVKSLILTSSLMKLDTK